MRRGNPANRGQGRPVSWCMGGHRASHQGRGEPSAGGKSLKREQSPGASSTRIGLARSTSYQALHSALARLYRIDDFTMERIGQGFFSEVYKVSQVFNC